MRRLIACIAAGAACVTGAAALAWLKPDLNVDVDLSAAVGRGERAAMEAAATAGMTLEALTVEGRVMTSREDLLAAVGAEAGVPILSVDLARAHAAVAALPWVKHAEVSRQLPGRIHIVIEERTAFALWQRDSRYTLVDREGTPIIDVPAGGQGLPLIVGGDAPRHAAALFDALAAEPALAARVRAAVHIGARRWDVYFDDNEKGTAVRLPEDGVAEAWSRLAALEQGYRILERDLEFIDLRLPDQLIVRLNKAPADGDGEGAATEKPLPLPAPGPRQDV